MTCQRCHRSNSHRSNSHQHSMSEQESSLQRENKHCISTTTYNEHKLQNHLTLATLVFFELLALGLLVALTPFEDFEPSFMHLPSTQWKEESQSLASQSSLVEKTSATPNSPGVLDCKRMDTRGLRTERARRVREHGPRSAVSDRSCGGQRLRRLTGGQAGGQAGEADGRLVRGHPRGA